MNKLLIGILLLLASCTKNSTINNNEPPVNHACDYLELEDNNTADRAQFIANFTPPDHYKVCGTFDNPSDIDWLQFFTPLDEYVSLIITCESPVELFIFTRNLPSNDLELRGHFYGDPGELAVLDFPLQVDNDGFLFRLSNTTHSIKDYKVEMWTQGFIH